ncbi:MAG TPA: dienelactone hydrolase family protein [Acidimicrobiia bacterium]|nr:dienelactone hydrolase family protein [Acidimicrobiia bacterium]
MTAIKGEGKYAMLYGSYRLPVGRDLSAYIARPDLSGSFPTIVVAHGVWGLSSHVKSVSRRLARYGFAVICPDLYRRSLPGRLDDRDDADARWAALPAGRAARDLVEAFENADALGTDWADGRRIGVLALGAGGGPAIEAARSIDALGAMALVYAPVTADGLRLLGVPLLGIYGADDVVVAAAEVRDAREAAGRGEFALYAGVGHDFLDEMREGYHHPSAEDALTRITDFFEARLATPVGA